MGNAFQQRRLRWNLAGDWEILFDPTDQMTITEFLARNNCSITAIPSVFNVSEQGAGYIGSVWYRRSVSVVQTTGLFELYVEGWYGKAEFFWNDTKLGERNYGWTPFSIYFKLPDALPKENGLITGKLSIHIDNRAQPGATYQWTDFMPWGGIHRNIEIISVSDPFFERANFGCNIVDLTTGETDLHCKAVLLCTDSTLSPENDRQFQVTVELQRNDQIVPFRTIKPIKFVATNKHVVIVGSDTTIPLTEYQVELTAHAECELWSLQIPALYLLNVQLISEEKVLDEIGYQVGIREVDTNEHGQLLINGRPTLFLGTTRHDDHPEFGPAFNPQLIEHDLQIMKDYGFTGIRPGHYPTTDHFLNIADQLGIMVMEEVPNYIMTSEMMQDPLVLDQQLHALREMITAHRNHPCIVIWSIANECKSDLPESKAMLRGLADPAHHLDLTRPVHFTGFPGIQNIVDCSADLVGINVYYGDSVSGQSISPDVLGGVLDNLRSFMEDSEVGMRNVPIFITEFGSQTVYGYHEIAPYRGKNGASTDTPYTIFTEERQAYVIEQFIEQIKSRPFVAGVLVWCWRDNRYEPGIAQSSAGTIMRYGLLDWNGAPKLAFAILSRLFKSLTNDIVNK